jgi:ectoine hydroxylase-related dioxygenase (phytanoyl-CoA dioxygenase family)
MATLDENGILISDLWLDQPDALDRVEARRAAGALSGEDAARLVQFARDGFTSISLSDAQRIDERVDAEVERLWTERPTDVAIGLAEGGRISVADATDDQRVVGYRIADLHSWCPAALDLYLHSEIFHIVELIFDQPAIAFQSLYFQWGSEQALHRDPMFVAATPPSHLVASWIALEDITEDSGPLIYAPGSHRLPWFEFAPDDIKARDADKAGRERWARERQRVIDEAGLEPKTFTCRQGDVFIWHAGLLHGGAKVGTRERTRKSFVVHYSTAANYHSRRASMKRKAIVDGKETWVATKGFTTEVIERPGARGLDSPLRHLEVKAPAAH